MNILIKLKLRNNIIKFIRQNIVLFNSFDNVYLFGSILDSNKIPNDIDILLIYSKYKISLIEELNNICFILEKTIKLPVDLTVLSIEEEREFNFLKKNRERYLKLK